LLPFFELFKKVILPWNTERLFFVKKPEYILTRFAAGLINKYEVITMKAYILPFNKSKIFSLRLALVSGLLALLLTLTGCQIIADWTNQPRLAPGEGSNQTDSDDNKPSLSDYQQSITRITEGIRFELLLNQDSWRSGDKIKAVIRVTNTTDQPIPWQAGSMSFGPAGSIRASIVLQGSDIWLLEDGEPRMGDTAMLYGQLEPGESIEKTVIWTTTYTLNGDDILQAWTGDHILNITFARGQDDNNAFLSWQHAIKITADEDNRQAISRDHAIDIARGQPAYDLFRLAHSGESVAKETDGQFWVNFSGTWELVSEELYQETFKKIMAPGASAVWTDGTWTVTFSEKLGDPPNELVIIIDGYSDEVLAVQ
jgi:hypothetical protein